MSGYVVMPKDDYAAICNATRAKTGSKELLKSNEVPTQIENISGVQYTANGQIYTEHVIVPETITELTANIYAIFGIKSVYAPEVTTTTGHYCFGNSSTKTMETIICPKLANWASNSYWCSGGNLKTVQAGSVGYPVVSMDGGGGFRNNTRTDLVITVYVDALAFEDIPEKVITQAPWGAVNATIIYRNSTTGEVITA